MQKQTSAQRVAAVVNMLKSHGWVSDGVGGVTLTGNVRGVMMGRTRYHVPETDLYATVGERTVCVYRKQAGVITEAANFKTSDLRAITQCSAYTAGGSRRSLTDIATEVAQVAE